MTPGSAIKFATDCFTGPGKKRYSADCVYCIYSNAFQITFTQESNTMNPNQTAPMSPHCLQYSNIKEMGADDNCLEWSEKG